MENTRPFRAEIARGIAVLGLASAFLASALFLNSTSIRGSASAGSDSAWADAIAIVQTDRENASVLQNSSLDEIEDHFGNADLFKRYIIKHPQRVA